MFVTACKDIWLMQDFLMGDQGKRTCSEWMDPLMHHRLWSSKKQNFGVTNRCTGSACIHVGGIFNSAWLCQQSSWNQNLSVVCVAIISVPNARITFEFWLLLPLGYTLRRFLHFFFFCITGILRIFLVFVNMRTYGAKIWKHYSSYKSQ